MQFTTIAIQFLLIAVEFILIAMQVIWARINKNSVIYRECINFTIEFFVN